MRFRLLLILFVLVGRVVPAEDDTDESKAIAKIELLGGQVTRDETLPGCPLTMINFERSKRFRGTYLHLIKPFPSLRSLVLDGTDVTDDSVKELCEFKHLKELWVNHTKLTDNGLDKLRDSLPDTTVFDKNTEESKVIDKLSELHGYATRDNTLPGRPVNEIDFGSSGFGSPVPLLNAFPSLRTLNLMPYSNTDSEMKEIKRLKSLRSLSAAGTEITNVGLKEISELTNLNSLNLFHTRISDDGLKELHNLKHLTTLWLTDVKEVNVNVTDVGLKEICEFENLRELLLQGSLITDAGLKELSKLKSLTVLDIFGSKITDDGLKEIGRLKNLTILRLSKTAITDSGIKELSELRNLTSLDLWGNRVTDGGIIELGKLTNLTMLNIRETHVTDAGIKELKKSLPNLQIMR